MNNLPVQMHPRYAEFLESIRDITLRKTPAILEFGFHVWLKTKKEQSKDIIDMANFSADCSVQIQALKRDLNIKHREVAELQKQLAIMSEEYERIDSSVGRDYAIWQAISDLERVCRHRTATAAEDWLQVEAENRTHIPTINYALEVLKAYGVEMDSKIGFPNIRIIYDRSKNKFFGKA
jgi:hypothetical protein